MNKRKQNNEENAPQVLKHAVFTPLKSHAVYTLCSPQLCVSSACTPTDL